MTRDGYRRAWRRNVVDTRIIEWDERLLAPFDAAAYVVLPGESRRFASVHHNPPAKDFPATAPALTEHRYGAGRCRAHRGDPVMLGVDYE